MIGRAELAALPWNRWLGLLEQSVTWWLEGIKYPLPQRLRDTLFAPHATVTVEVSEDRLLIYREHSVEKPRTLIHRVELAPETETVDFGANPIEDDAHVILLLVPGQYLTTRMVLPIAAGRELRNVVRHELERRMPFTVDEVWFEFVVSARDDAANQLHLDVYVAPRETVGELLRKLEGFGARPTEIKLSEHTEAPPRDPFGVDLLKHAPYARRRRYRLPCRLNILAGLAVVFLATLHAPLIRYGAIGAEISMQVAEARQTALELQSVTDERAQWLARNRFLEDQRASHTAPLAILRELTETLPEHTWLTRLSISRSQVQLEGETAAATDILGVVENSPYLEAAEFGSPITKAGSSDKERFDILARPKRGPR